jgi:fumarylacetoacetase
VSPLDIDPALTSWVESANDAGSDFPVQNLAFGRYRDAASGGLRIAVAIGDQALDLQRAGLIDHQEMERLLTLPRAERVVLRQVLSAGLRRGSADEAHWREALLSQASLAMALPCEIGDYTDFYIGIHHATAVGKLFRPDHPLLPNYKWVPIGYHGRASSINVSPSSFKRPRGQQRGADGAAPPVFGPSKRVDHELELGLVIGRGNAQGEPIPIERAEEHLFGVALFNDWSARDLQAWEYQPLGPFLAKNFASTLSPWVVTMEALAPFRAPFARPEGDPQPLPYLDSPANRSQGNIDVALEVWLQTTAMRAAGHAGDRISRSNFTDGYWTAAQLVAHHSVNGCNLQAGDLFGTGTLSGPGAGQGGSLLELTQGGKQPIRLSNGETRTFLEDGDSIILRGTCERAGFRRIGFGECRGTVLGAIDA